MPGQMKHEGLEVLKTRELVFQLRNRNPELRVHLKTNKNEQANFVCGCGPVCMCNWGGSCILVGMRRSEDSLRCQLAFGLVWDRVSRLPHILPQTFRNSSVSTSHLHPGTLRLQTWTSFSSGFRSSHLHGPWLTHWALSPAPKVCLMNHQEEIAWNTVL